MLNNRGICLMTAAFALAMPCATPLAGNFKGISAGGISQAYAGLVRDILHSIWSVLGSNSSARRSCSSQVMLRSLLMVT